MIIEGLVIISIFCGFILILIVMISMGCAELVIARKLGKRGEKVEGRIEYVDLKSSRPGGIYGKIQFTYSVNNRTYTKKQSVDKDTALVFLAARPALSWLAKSDPITVIFLPKRPSIARLAAAPSDRMRVLNFVVALIVFCFIAALILISVLIDINRYPGY